MHIILFLYRKIRGNTFGSASQKTYTSVWAYVLAWVLPSNFHRIIENPNRNFASHKCKNDYLLGRYASNVSLHRGDKHVLRHSNLLVTTSGFYSELEKSLF